MQVVGDKKAARASRIARGPEGIKALRDLEKKLGVQLKFIHVVRNPFDNIATMTLRRAQERKKGQVNLKVRIRSIHWARCYWLRCCNAPAIFLSFFVIFFPSIYLDCCRVAKLINK